MIYMLSSLTEMIEVVYQEENFLLDQILQRISPGIIFKFVWLPLNGFLFTHII